MIRSSTTISLQPDDRVMLGDAGGCWHGMDTGAVWFKAGDTEITVEGTVAQLVKLQGAIAIAIEAMDKDRAKHGDAAPALVAPAEETSNV